MENPTPNSGSVGDVALPEDMASTGRANSPSEPLPKRKQLPHEIPSWVQQGERHFITINCAERNATNLLRNNIADHLLESARFYDETGKWCLWIMVVMPDHIHFIATFDLSKGIRPTITAWKRYQAIHQGVEWQPDFFEHRLRNPAEFVEKCHYIRMNPVRKNLVSAPEQWSYIIDRTTLNSGSVGDVALPAILKSNGRANSPSEPHARNNGSVGDVALPKKPHPTEKAKRPAEPESEGK